MALTTAPLVSIPGGVRVVVGVTPGAMGLSGVDRPQADAAPDVFALGYRLEVRRVATDRVAAQVVEDEPVGNRTHESFVDDAMGPPVAAELPVSVSVQLAVPFPAVTAVDDARQDLGRRPAVHLVTTHSTSSGAVPVIPWRRGRSPRRRTARGTWGRRRTWRGRSS